MRSWREAAVAAGIDVWQRNGEDEWMHDDPPEDLALPHCWTGRTGPSSSRCRRTGKPSTSTLEPGQYYVMVWPPEASLWSRGSWSFSDLDECGEHGNEYDAECTECPPDRARASARG